MSSTAVRIRTAMHSLCYGVLAPPRWTGAPCERMFPMTKKRLPTTYRRNPLVATAPISGAVPQMGMGTMLRFLGKQTFGHPVPGRIVLEIANLFINAGKHGC